ncbi:MAG TPA: nitrile hydratase subunit beta [Acidimicrobiales bacterium]|nr:nitrile hydratase subunit beta [Acidimicrobiales bacterium]
MDTIADMGGMQGMGKVELTPPDDPPFHEEWERRAFAMALLAMRTAGTNLDTFRYALECQHPLDYLLDGYYGRWLKCAENMLEESAIIAPGAVEARARKLAGEETVEEPPAPEPRKPDYKPTAAGSIRQIDAPPKFAVGDRVRAKLMHPPRHTRLARYVRGRTGVVTMIQPAQVLPDTNAHFIAENAQHVYNVSFDSHELWGPDAESFELRFDLYEDYMEPA